MSLRFPVHSARETRGGCHLDELELDGHVSRVALAKAVAERVDDRDHGRRRLQRSLWILRLRGDLFHIGRILFFGVFFNGLVLRIIGCGEERRGREGLQVHGYAQSLHRRQRPDGRGIPPLFIVFGCDVPFGGGSRLALGGLLQGEPRPDVFREELAERVDGNEHERGLEGDAGHAKRPEDRLKVQRPPGGLIEVLVQGGWTQGIWR